MFELFVEVGTTGDERPLVTLEVVGPSGRRSRFHLVQVLESLERQLHDKVLRPENEAAYKDAISIGVELHWGHIDSCRKGWNGRRSPAQKNSAEMVMQPRGGWEGRSFGPGTSSTTLFGILNSS